MDLEGQRWLADHRARCEACDTSFTRLERLLDTLARLDRPEPRAGFADRVLADVRPAPAPVWARWRIRGVWGRAAAAAVLAAAGLAALFAPTALGLAYHGLGGPGSLFRGPGLVAGGIVALVNGLDPFRPLATTGSALASAVAAIATTPQVLSILAAFAAASAAAFLRLSHMLVSPPRRSLEHA